MLPTVLIFNIENENVTVGKHAFFGDGAGCSQPTPGNGWPSQGVGWVATVPPHALTSTVH
jgi:hypothetical protein